MTSSNSEDTDSGPEKHSALELVTHEVLQISTYWHLRCRLFTDSNKNFNLTQQYAMDFFDRVKILLDDSIVLGLARLTDRQRGTATFGRVLVGIEKLYGKSEELKKTSKKINELEQLVCDSIRKHRNECIAHSKIDTNLPAIPYAHVGQAISLATEIFNQLKSLVKESTTDVQNFAQSCSGSGIVQVLRMYDFLLHLHRQEPELDDATLRLAVKRSTLPSDPGWSKFPP